MPVKTKNHQSKKFPHHFNKVYWPYLPLFLLVLSGIWLGHSSVYRSQRGVLEYTSEVSANSLLVDTNAARQSNNQAILNENSQLDQAANAKAQDMVTRNYWSHITPDGRTPWAFIDSTTYQYQKAGENLAYGFVDSNEVIKGWLNSPAHKANLLDNRYTEVGFGIVNSPDFQGHGPETIVVALYAQPGKKPAGLGVANPSSAGYNTDNPFVREANQTISKAQAMTSGQAPWVTFALGIAGGLSLAYVLIKNSVLIHRKLRKGERFILHHPILDITLVVFIGLCVLLSQSIGLIR
ncbi:MAG: CAP domain-containing protein [Candidatus Saccharibacteria bacterium]